MSSTVEPARVLRVLHALHGDDLSVFDDVAREDVTIVAPPIRIERSIAKALDGRERHMQRMVRVVVRVESLTSE